MNIIEEIRRLNHMLALTGVKMPITITLANRQDFISLVCSIEAQTEFHRSYNPQPHNATPNEAEVAGVRINFAPPTERSEYGMDGKVTRVTKKVTNVPGSF